MRENLEMSGGLFFSEGVLLAMVKKGRPRQAAYEVVQRSAMRAFEGNGTFRENLKADADVLAVLTPADVDAAFSLDHALAHCRAICERALDGE
jgi:adenylosuccinate lyase